ncbi:MAG: hypothetical protein JST78_09375 [Bacteroidetes bacterium]|nr:hypothetical protein [Bacteroidota bacterium]
MNTSNYERYSWTTLWVALGIVLGLLIVTFYAYYENVNANTLLLWSLAYMVMGSLSGFIFSVPKIISASGTTSTNNPNGTEVSGKVQKIQENTNLTEISDWLTKIIIGAGLVEIKEAPKFILHIARVMGQGIRKVPLADHQMNSSNIIDSVTIMCAAIILYFLIWGFISGYLVMKLILTEQFATTQAAS